MANYVVKVQMDLFASYLVFNIQILSIKYP